jgi:hypothetical protein
MNHEAAGSGERGALRRADRRLLHGGVGARRGDAQGLPRFGPARGQRRQGGGLRARRAGNHQPDQRRLDTRLAGERDGTGDGHLHWTFGCAEGLEHRPLAPA